MPIWNEKKDICLIFSGEDFTDLDEIAGLRSRGHDFLLGNASYLVHLYEETGTKTFEKWNGRFSGVIIDFRQECMLLFNDRYGLNRIYYYDNPKGLFFSSEAKSILTVFPELRRLDHLSLAETFSLGCVLQNRTVFSEISLIPGGSVWTYSPKQGTKKHSYFGPEAWENQGTLTDSEYYDKLKTTWARILPRYWRGNEQIALSLTGGKDSRMILAWAHFEPGTLPCYTFGGSYRDCQDVKIAREVARISGQPHQVISVDRTFIDEFPNLAERTIYLTDGTLDVSASPDLYVNKIARQIAPIRLTGNYGQEILRGDIAFKPRAMSPGILDGDFSRLIKNSALTYAKEMTDNQRSFVAFKQMPWHHYSRLALELSQITVRSPFLDNDLVALCFQAPIERSASVEMQLRLIWEGNPALAKVGTDRAVLLVPIPLVTRAKEIYQEFTFKAEYAYDYGMPQFLAKLDRVLKPLHLENLFLGRHKFAHFRIWYRDQLSWYIKEILLDSRTRSRPYLNGRLLEKSVIAHTRGAANFTSEIHRILTTELIQRLFID